MSVRTLLAAALTAALSSSALVVASPTATAVAAGAGPGTLLYVKNHNIYVSRPDGTGTRQLTTSGTSSSPWRSPSGTDSGIVVAARGGVVYRMDQWGTVLNSFDPPDTTDTAGQPIGGTITHAAISPDGTKVAYTYEHYSCPPRLACKTRWATAVSAANRLTPLGQYGPSMYDNPTWVSSSRLLLSGGGVDGIIAFDLGARSSYWFNDGDGTGYYTGPVTDPALNRAGTQFAAVYGGMIVVYQMNGDVRSGSLPGSPSPRCSLSTTEKIGDPTFAPDGAGLAWQEGNDVWAKPAPLDCDAQPRRIIVGGSSPTWTGAALQTKRPTYPFVLVSKPRVAGKAQVGRRLTAIGGRWTPSPASITYQWLRNGKAVTGATTPRYKVRKADRHDRLAVRVTVRRPGYLTKVVSSRAIRVR